MILHTYLYTPTGLFQRGREWAVRSLSRELLELPFNGLQSDRKYSSTIFLPVRQVLAVYMRVHVRADECARIRMI